MPQRTAVQWEYVLEVSVHDVQHAVDASTEGNPLASAQTKTAIVEPQRAVTDGSASADSIWVFV